ncbi:uncharacterized protein DS421_18g605420 [Arachis hypogaea]|nr:uncharacterized protein DS421_18g605420 [Arachis hypogaea]
MIQKTMKNQIMPTSLIILFVVLSFASDGGLLVEAQLWTCHKLIPFPNCTFESCRSHCRFVYSSPVSIPRGSCNDNNTKCLCTYTRLDPGCHSEDHLI